MRSIWDGEDPCSFPAGVKDYTGSDYGRVFSVKILSELKSRAAFTLGLFLPHREQTTVVPPSITCH